MNIIAERTKAVIGLEHCGIAMTPEEFDAITECDENYHYELIQGRLIVTPPPLEEQRDPNDELGYWLRAYRDRHPQGAALDKTLPEHPIRTPTNRRIADRVIWAGLGRAPDPVTDLPSIAVEFVSEARRDWLRDYIEKRDEYMQAGIGEYWIIDRFRRTMTVYLNEPTGPREQVVHENETYRTPRLPGFELPLAPLLALADSWERAP
jgi:Uma2 family endonuclease